MADELEFYGDPSGDTGLTVIARVYDGTGTQVGTDVSCTEVGSLAIYQGDMPTAGAGSYAVRFFNSTTLLGQGVINWDGSAEVTDQTLNTAISSKATQSSIDALNDISSADVAAAVPTTAEIEAALLNEGDGQQLIDAIVQAIGNENITAATIASQVRTELTTELARIDANVSSAQTPSEVNANIVKVNNIAIDGEGTKENPFGP